MAAAGGSGSDCVGLADLVLEEIDDTVRALGEEIPADVIASVLKELGRERDSEGAALSAVVRAVRHKAGFKLAKPPLLASIRAQNEAKHPKTGEGCSRGKERSMPDTRALVPLAASDPGADNWGKSMVRVRRSLGMPAPAALAGLLPDWEEDTSRTHCPICNREFVGISATTAAMASMGMGKQVLWRHHCRCCGVLVCCRCSSHVVELAALGKAAKPSRICDFCNFDLMSSAEVAAPALLPP